MLTPRGLMSAVLSITCALIVVLREQNLLQSKNWRHSGLTMKDHHITRAIAFKNQSTIPKATFIEIGVNQKRKTKKTKTTKKKKKKKDRRKKEGVRYRIRNQRHRLPATSPYHYNTQNN